MQKFCWRSEPEVHKKTIVSIRCGLERPQAAAVGKERNRGLSAFVLLRYYVGNSYFNFINHTKERQKSETCKVDNLDLRNRLHPVSGWDDDQCRSSSGR